MTGTKLGYKNLTIPLVSVPFFFAAGPAGGFSFMAGGSIIVGIPPAKERPRAKLNSHKMEPVDIIKSTLVQ